MLAALVLCIVLNAVIATLDHKQLSLEQKEFHAPPLEEIANVLNEGLKKNFEDVLVQVVDCPDLREPPFALANVGLNGDTRLAAIGGLQNLFPLPDMSRQYDVRQVLQRIGLKSGFVIGACDVPLAYTGVNGQGITNINIDGDKIDQKSVIVTIKNDGSYVAERLPNNETRFDRLGDFFVSQGKPGPVLKVHVRKRIGKESFSKSIRSVLQKHYGDKILGLGGTFILQKGQILQHLLPDFQKNPIYTNDDLQQWMKYFNMSAPMTGVGVITTGDYGLRLHKQHFHTFNNNGDGGHYHIDTTPDIVEYLAYLNTAQHVDRIDRPHSKFYIDNL